MTLTNEMWQGNLERRSRRIILVSALIGAAYLPMALLFLLWSIHENQASFIPLLVGITYAEILFLQVMGKMVALRRSLRMGSPQPRVEGRTISVFYFIGLFVTLFSALLTALLAKSGQQFTGLACVLGCLYLSQPQIVAVSSLKTINRLLREGTSLSSQ